MVAQSGAERSGAKWSHTRRGTIYLASHFRGNHIAAHAVVRRARRAAAAGRGSPNGGAAEGFAGDAMRPSPAGARQQGGMQLCKTGCATCWTALSESVPMVLCASASAAASYFAPATACLVAACIGRQQGGVPAWLMCALPRQPDLTGSGWRAVQQLGTRHKVRRRPLYPTPWGRLACGVRPWWDRSCGCCAQWA
jgi:hypothetical protein